MELLGVQVEVPANTPVLMLRERAGLHRVLPIYIGGPEASSIHQAIEGIEAPRPLTHDLFVDVLEALEVQLAEVVITEMRDHTFYAELHLTSRGTDRRLSVSSRPSDAIALAVRVGCEIFCEERVLAEAGQVPEPEPASAEEIIDEFRDFIDNVTPDDFAGS